MSNPRLGAVPVSEVCCSARSANGGSGGLLVEGVDIGGANVADEERRVVGRQPGPRSKNSLGTPQTCQAEQALDLEVAHPHAIEGRLGLQECVNSEGDKSKNEPQ